MTADRVEEALRLDQGLTGLIPVSHKTGEDLLLGDGVLVAEEVVAAVATRGAEVFLLLSRPLLTPLVIPQAPLRRVRHKAQEAAAVRLMHHRVALPARVMRKRTIQRSAARTSKAASRQTLCPHGMETQIRC